MNEFGISGTRYCTAGCPITFAHLAWLAPFIVPGSVVAFGAFQWMRIQTYLAQYQTPGTAPLAAQLPFKSAMVDGTRWVLDQECPQTEVHLVKRERKWGELWEDFIARQGLASIVDLEVIG